MTLRKRDFQLFMKRLRKLCPDAKLKYYAVGEYGTQNNRPHYHAIIFNCKNPDHYNESWGLGQIHVGQVTGDSIAYTMKYIDKPGVRRLHARDDRELEFPLMSKGLGANYLSPEIIHYHKSDLSRMYVTKEGGHRVALPRYYRQKIYTDTDLKLQVELIQTAMIDADAAERREFARLQYPPDFTFEQWQDMKKHGRYRNFYSQLKNRNT